MGGGNLIAVVGTTVTGTLTISAGGGDNSVLGTDDYNETIDSSLQTFVTVHTVFGDGLGDGELTDPCVVTLADDLNAASSAGFSFHAQSANINVLNGNNIIDVHDASLSGGNLMIMAGGGTNVIAVTETTVTTVGSSVGNVTITTGNGDNLIILVGLDLLPLGGLTVATGSGNDVIMATPNVGTVVDAAIVDFVANHPGVFFDPTGADSGGVLDIADPTQEIIDISDVSGFQAYKAIITTSDLAARASEIDISQSDVTTTLTIQMGNGSDGLFLSEVQVGDLTDTGDREPDDRQRQRHDRRRRSGCDRRGTDVRHERPATGRRDELVQFDHRWRQQHRGDQPRLVGRPRLCRRTGLRH